MGEAGRTGTWQASEICADWATSARHCVHDLPHHLSGQFAVHAYGSFDRRCWNPHEWTWVPIWSQGRGNCASLPGYSGMSSVDRPHSAIRIVFYWIRLWLDFDALVTQVFSVLRTSHSLSYLNVTTYDIVQKHVDAIVRFLSGNTQLRSFAMTLNCCRHSTSAERLLEDCVGDSDLSHFDPEWLSVAGDWGVTTV